MADKHKHEHKGEHTHGQEHGHERHDDKHDQTVIRMKRMVTTMGRKLTGMNTHMPRSMVTPMITDTDTAIPMATTTNRASKIPLMPPSSTSAGCPTCVAQLTAKLIEAMTLKGGEAILDLATGTGRVARPLSKQMQSGTHRRCRARRWRCSTSAIIIKIRSPAMN